MGVVSNHSIIEKFRLEESLGSLSFNLGLKAGSVMGYIETIQPFGTTCFPVSRGKMFLLLCLILCCFSLAFLPCAALRSMGPASQSPLLGARGTLSASVVVSSLGWLSPAFSLSSWGKCSKSHCLGDPLSTLSSLSMSFMCWRTKNWMWYLDIVWRVLCRREQSLS